jgi:hypothetical protein
MSKGLKTNRLITNANAPIATITITIDNRYDPPEIAMQNSHMMPASLVAAHLNNCLGNVLGMMVAAEAQALSGKKPEEIPNLPPVPSPAEK